MFAIHLWRKCPRGGRYVCLDARRSCTCRGIMTFLISGARLRNYANFSVS